MMYTFISIQWTKNEKTLDECCGFEHKWKIARGYISKSIRRTRLKFSPWESTAMITIWAKFNRNPRCRVLFRDFFGRSVVECPKGQTKKTWFRAAIHVLGQIFAKNAKNDPKTLLKRQNRSKNKIRKITVKSRNDVKSACFWHVLCYISAIFEDIDLKFCIHIHETLPSNICYGFLEILIWGKLFWKEKNGSFFENFPKFSKFSKSEITVL